MLPTARFCATYRSVSVILCWLVVLLAGPACAEENDESAEQESFFGEVVDVNLVNVEVYVTDKQGHRISGLTKDDFVLEVDKTPVAITNFYAVENGRPVGVDAHAVVETLDRPDLPTPGRRLEAEDSRPEDQQLHLIVYIDNFNLKPFSRNRVLRNTRTWLRQNVQLGDKVMLVTYERSLHVRHPFTRDPELIANATYELEDISAHRIHYESERRQIMDEIYNDAENAQSIYGRVRQYAESISNDMAFTLDALKDQVDSLAGLPGRKAILYVSEGLPWSPAEDAFHAVAQQFDQTSVLMETHRFDLNRKYQALISTANANRVTFYTIDAAGLRTYTYMDAANQTAGGGANIDQIHFSNMQNTLRFLAEETGGIAMLNTNNFLPMMERMGDDFRSYYSLGFPAVGRSGRYHRIRVRLKEDRKGVRLRYREGFRDKPVNARMTEATLAALHYGYQKNELGVELQATKATRQEDGQYLVPLVVSIPIGQLALLPQEGMHRGRVKLFVAAKDLDGGVAPVQEVPVPIDIPASDIEQAKGQYYQYTLTMLMRKGRQVVSVTARDEIGATVGVVSTSVGVGV
ncbi:MAG: VWA domain-containing protein [Thermoanaerobaculia bacterium]|nr:VWA domain-containing protein [Thermoanaerobaculia bacterium]